MVRNALFIGCAVLYATPLNNTRVFGKIVCHGLSI